MDENGSCVPLALRPAALPQRSCRSAGLRRTEEQLTKLAANSGNSQAHNL
jgi:hypothetical protein